MQQSTLDKIKKNNLHLLRIIDNYTEEKKEEIWKGLINNYKEEEKTRNKNDYEKHKKDRLKKMKERNCKIVECPLCNCKIKYSSLTKHKNNNKCKLNKLLKDKLVSDSSDI
jgi:hypothetical protein